MTWFAQLRHLLIKDLTEHRWTVLLYVVAVLAATGHALGWQLFSAPVLGMTMVIIGIIGAVLAASVVQGDSPTRSDAFWASQPIDASATLAVKLILGVAVIGLPLLAQVIALHGYDIEWGDAFARSLHDSRMYALIVVGALVIAGLTRDLKSFLLTVIAIPIALLICVAIVTARKSSWGMSLTGEEAGWATLLCAFVELVLLVWLYHTRDTRWPVRLAGFALVGLSFAGLATSSAPLQAGAMRAAPGVPQVPLRLDWATVRSGVTPPPLGMTLTIGAAPDGMRYEIQNTSASVTARDGSTDDVWVASSEFSASLRSVPTPPAFPGIRWLNVTREDSDAVTADRTVSLSPVLSDEQREKLRAGIERVVLKGFMAVTQLKPGDTLTAARGAVVVHDGRRIEVERWEHTANGLSLEVRTRRAAVPSPFSPGEFAGAEDIVLVNRARGEGVVLLQEMKGFSGDGIVIPGSTMTSQLVRYTVRSASNRRPAIDDAWLRDATLQVIDDVPLGRYPVTLPPLSAPPAAQTIDVKTPGGR